VPIIASSAPPTSLRP